MKLGILLRLLLAFASSNGAKVNKLVMLAMVPRTGDEPRNALSCIASMQVAVDAANESPKILPDYHIEVQFENEGGQAALAPVGFMNFMDRFQRNSSNGAYLAPIVVGTMFLCQTSSGLVRYFNMVQFSQGCVGTLYTHNRKRFPNLYRVVIAAEMITLPMIFVVKNIGNWRQVAIISNSGNINNDLAASVFYTVAVNSKVEVVWFTGVSDIDASILGSLKDSDARVVAAFMVETPVVLKFFCLTYMLGLTAPKYIFIFQNRAFNDPDTPGLQLPPGCNKAMLAEQLKISFFTGLANVALTNYGLTGLGYDLVGFEQRFNKAMNNSRLPDYAQRHQCQDGMEGAILALNSADKTLRSSYNLTLKDFKQYPDLVMQTLNASAARSDFVGLRIGKIAYSQRLEVDSEAMYVMQWTNKTMRTIGRVAYGGFTEADIYNFSFYNASVLSPIVWATKNGQPPKDLSTVQRLVTALPYFLYPMMTTSCVLLSTIQIASLKFSMSNFHERPVFSYFIDVSLVLGCLALNVASVLYSLNLTSQSICVLRYLFCVAGLSLVNANSFMQQIVIAFEAKAHLFRYYMSRLGKRKDRAQTMRTVGTLASKPTRPSAAISVKANKGLSKVTSGVSATTSTTTLSVNSSIPTTGSTSTNGSSGNQATHTNSTQSRITAKSLQCRNGLLHFGIAAFTLLDLAILAIGLGIEPPRINSVVSAVFFDDDDDTYYDIQTDICRSSSQSYYLGILLGINAIGLVFAACLAFQTRHMVYSGALHFHVRSVRLAVANSTTLFLVGAFMVVIIPPLQIGLQAIVLTFLLLIYSITSSAILIYPKINFAPKVDEHPINDHDVTTHSLHVRPLSTGQHMGAISERPNNRGYQSSFAKMHNP